jgi:hypothetical protein
MVLVFINYFIYYLFIFIYFHLFRSTNRYIEVERKDAIIIQLSADLVDVEAQFQTAIRSHTQHLDRLLALHRDRLTLLCADARQEHAALFAEFEEERERRRRKHAEDRGELREVMDRMEVAHKAAEGESKQEFQQQRQDIKVHKQKREREGEEERRGRMENKGIGRMEIGRRGRREGGR